MLNENSVIPLYYQLKELLREKIKGGALKEGEKVPSERELMELYNISRATARKALNDLMIEGLIQRKQGLGTFVAPKKVLQDLTGEISFVRQAREQGLRPKIKVIRAEIEKQVPERVLSLFNIAPSEKVYHIGAIAYADEQPLLLGTNYIPLKLAPDIEKLDIENTVFFEYLQHDLNIEITHSTLEIDPILLDEFNADFLNSEVGKPALSVERLYYSGEHVVFIEKRVVLGERTKYLFTLKHDTNKNVDYSFEMKIDK